MTQTLCWFDTRLPFRTLSGDVVERTPLDLTLDHGNGSPGSGNPIIGVVARHSYIEVGFRFLMRDVLQVALAPASTRDWARLVEAPPTPDELRAKLESYRPAFMLDDPRHPTLQVQPSPERLAEMVKPKPRNAKQAAEATPEDEDDDGGAMPVAALLPDAPTANALANSRDFFVKRDMVGAIGAGAVLPVLYAHMVLFPLSGGGYFGLPHGADSLKFWIAGRTLWTSIAVNLLTRDHPAMRSGVWPPPCDATTFPWLDPNLRDLSLKKGDPAARKTLHHVGDLAAAGRLPGQASLHPAAIPMARRYRLCPPSERTCDLTGVTGPAFSQYERWPNGLQYAPAAWWATHAAPIDVREWSGSAWVPRKAKPKAGTDGEAALAENAEAAGPRFLKARGPLRFDQWLQLSLKDPPSPPDQGKKVGQEWSGVRHPPVVSAFMAGEAALRGAATEQVSALTQKTDYRLEAVAAVPEKPNGKALGGFSRGSLALWHVEDQAAEVIATAVRDTLEAADEVARALGSAARDAATNSDKTPVLAGQLRDGLLTALDARLAEAAQDMFRAYEGRADQDAAQHEVGRRQSDLVRDMGREALTLFDATFRFATIDQTGIRIAGARRKLAGAVGAIVRSHTSQQRARTQRVEAEAR